MILKWAEGLWDKIETSRKARGDMEFLPAALEIVETPPSPNHVSFMLAICALVVVALGWSYFSRIDIVAVAQGKIQPTGRVKTIQPVDGGKVVAVKVENGATVKAGDLLIELDPADAVAEAAAARAALEAARAEALRRKTALDAVRNDTLRDAQKIAWGPGVPTMTRLREERVLADDLSQLSASLLNISAQITQKEAEKAKLERMIATQEALLSVLRQRVEMRESLLRQKAGTKTALIDAQEAFSYHRTNLVSQAGQLREIQASLQVLESDKNKLLKGFVADNSQKLAEAERISDEFEQKLAKATVRVSHTRLVSPIDGIVFGSVITTTGQVISAGEEIMRIVPKDARLEVEGYIENKDIGFVKAGQQAIVKVEAFPFTRYGVIDAEVIRVSDDAVPEPDVQSQEGNPARSGKALNNAGTQRVQNLMFPVTLRPKAISIRADGAEYPLSPGMAVVIEIKTGSRRALEYVFSPLVETGASAMKER